MGLPEDLERAATHAARRAAKGEKVAAVLAAEPTAGARCYLCAFASAADERSWLALDDDGNPVADRRDLRDLVSITALCEIAAETAGGGDLDELGSRLELLRGEPEHEVDDALAALADLRSQLGSPPQLATPARLDAIGQATRRLELALDPTASSPFAEAMRAAQGAVEELAREVEATYRVELDASANR